MKPSNTSSRSADGLDALGRLFATHPLRSCSLYLNYLGPKAQGALTRAVSGSGAGFKALNLQFSDLFVAPPNQKGADAEADFRRAAEMAGVAIEL